MTQEPTNFSYKPQVPKKPGEWWARLDLEDGEIHFGRTMLLPTGVIWWEAIGRTRACAVNPEDGDKWHKIELPKGWE
jgi:hypothetical protein